MTDPARSPRRTVHIADALVWLRECAAPASEAAGRSVVTSLPDVSETGLSLPVWRSLFLDAAGLCLEAVSDEGVAVFFQSDVKKDGATIDKAHLVLGACERAGARLLFHKIVCRKPAGTLSSGRPAFTHFLAFSRGQAVRHPTTIPDVIPAAGALTWPRAVGLKAVGHAVRFVRDCTPSTSILDPFCGIGTFLAVANAYGLDAVGVERNRKRAESARVLVVDPGEL